MITAFINSHLRCPRDGKRLVVDIGPEENEGVVEIVHRCLECPYVEQAPRTVAEAYRRSDVPQLRAVHESLAEALRMQRLEGVEIPLVYDRTEATVEEALREQP